MTDNDRMIILEAIRGYREIAAKAMLKIESLSALLPKQKKEKSNGYYTDPFGKKHFYDKAAERRHERDKLKLVIKEAS